MDKLKSWRWKRLFQKESYKREYDWGSFILIATVIATYLFTTLISVVAMWIFLLFICAYWINSICTADNYFYIEMLENDTPVKVKVHVFNQKNGHKLLFEKKDREEEIFVDEYVANGLWPKNVHNLLYRIGEVWYLLCNQSEQRILMGARVAKNVFAFTYLNSPEILLKILKDDSFEEFLVETYACGKNDLMVVQDGKSITSKTEENEEKNVCEHILIKQNGLYRLLELCPSVKNRPLAIKEAKARALIAKERQKTIVLVKSSEENQGYKELYNGYSFIRKAGLNILELSDRSGLCGKMLRFNPDSLKLSVVYDGIINGINFDNGEIICENHKSYNPKTGAIS